MLKKTVWVSLLLLVIGLFLHWSAVSQLQNESLEEESKNLAGSNLYIYGKSLDLDNDGKNENLIFKAYVNLPTSEKTEVFLNNLSKPVLAIHGFYRDSLTHDVSNNYRILEIQTSSGHSLNSLLYQYRNGQFTRISVSTEKSPYYEGIVSRNAPEFRDLDGDRVQEMLVYYRLYPPKEKRIVEIYKFSGDIFQKYQEYEETTTIPYL